MDFDNLEYIELALDSYDSSASSLNVSKTDWPTFYFKVPLLNIAGIKIIQAEIPFSYYTVNRYNNTFILKEGPSTATVTIPVGNYSTITIPATLSAALNAVSPSGHTYTVAYSIPMQKLVITSSSGDFTLTFGSADDTGNTNIRILLGMQAADNTSVSSTLISPNVVQLSGPNYLYLRSNSLTQVPLILPQGAVNNGGGNEGNQICRIPVNVNPGDVIYYTDPHPIRWSSLSNLNQLQQLDLYLSMGNESSDSPLELNGLSFSVKVGLLLYKQLNARVKQNANPYGTRMIIG